MLEGGGAGLVVDMILIPCCMRKVPGGSRSDAKSHLADLLGIESWRRLCDSRGELAEILGLGLSCDLDRTDALPKFDLLPAYRRYDGNLYRNARLSEADVSGDRRLFIVSALYGLLDARDPIRNYNVQMSDTLPGRITIKRWWRDKGLAEIVADTVERAGAKGLHELLSGNYRDALRGLSNLIPKTCAYIPYDYPGLGTGSDYHRGNDVRRLLGDGGQDGDKLEKRTVADTRRVATGSRKMNKYEPLTQYLESLPREKTRISMSFKEIERIIGAKLPKSAYTYRPWWGNQRDSNNRPQARAWLSAGFSVGRVQQSLSSGSVEFHRMAI